jgi:hypothetical protein
MVSYRSDSISDKEMHRASAWHGFPGLVQFRTVDRLRMRKHALTSLSK